MNISQTQYGNIKVISADIFDENTSLTMSQIAWAESRSYSEEFCQDVEGHKKLLSIDAPVNEMMSFVFNIKCTILEREIFTTKRNHVIWARTSRMDDVFEFSAPNNLFLREDQKEKWENHREFMRLASEDGESQDEFRMYMPMGAGTSFTTNMSFRDIVKMIQTLGLYYRRNPSQLNCIVETISNLKTMLQDYCMIDRDRLHEIIDTYKEDPVPFWQPELENNSHVNSAALPVGEFLIVSIKVPVAFRAQIIRERGLTVLDNLWTLAGRKDVLSHTLHTEMWMQISATKQYWKKMISQRQCWIAQHGLWKQLVEVVSKHIGISEEDLPCSDGVCPYDADARNRYIENHDPNPPCPRHAILTGTKISDEDVVRIAEDIIDNNRPKFWRDISLNAC